MALVVTVTERETVASGDGLKLMGRRHLFHFFPSLQRRRSMHILRTPLTVMFLLGPAVHRSFTIATPTTPNFRYSNSPGILNNKRTFINNFILFVTLQKNVVVERLTVLVLDDQTVRVGETCEKRRCGAAGDVADEKVKYFV